MPHKKASELNEEELEARRKYDREWKKAWRVAHPEEARLMFRKNYQTYREQELERKAGYYEKHKEHRREYMKEYRASKNGKAKTKEGGERYRAKRLNQFVEDIDRDAVFLRDGGVCHICGLLVETSVWHLDHIVPISKGGLHCYSNVAVSHPSCNRGKRDRDLREYVESRKKRQIK